MHKWAELREGSNGRSEAKERQARCGIERQFPLHAASRQSAKLTAARPLKKPAAPIQNFAHRNRTPAKLVRRNVLFRKKPRMRAHLRQHFPIMSCLAAPVNFEAGSQSSLLPISDSEIRRRGLAAAGRAPQGAVNEGEAVFQAGPMQFAAAADLRAKVIPLCRAPTLLMPGWTDRTLGCLAAS